MVGIIFLHKCHRHPWQSQQPSGAFTTWRHNIFHCYHRIVTEYQICTMEVCCHATSLFVWRWYILHLFVLHVKCCCMVLPLFFNLWHNSSCLFVTTASIPFWRYSCTLCFLKGVIGNIQLNVAFHLHPPSIVFKSQPYCCSNHLPPRQFVALPNIANSIQLTFTLLLLVSKC